MKPTRDSRKKSEGRKLKCLPPTEPSARDEGPRLLPLGDRISEPSKLDHYLDLADAALGLKGDTSDRRRPPNSTER
jgi:hypothetical protein